MRIATKQVQGVLILVVNESRLDANAAETFKEAFQQLLNEGHQAIAFDMGKIAFIDSSGLGAIVNCLKKIGPNGKLVLFGITAPVASMFKITRMDRVFNLCSNEEEALQAFEA